jgi:hypothetical protein
VLGKRLLPKQSGELQTHAHGARKVRQVLLFWTFAGNHQRWPRRRRKLPKSGYQNVEALDGHEAAGSEHRGWGKTQDKPQASPFFVRASVEHPRIERRRLDPALRCEGFRIAADERSEAFAQRSAREYQLGPVAAKDPP